MPYSSLHSEFHAELHWTGGATELYVMLSKPRDAAFAKSFVTKECNVKSIAEPPESVGCSAERLGRILPVIQSHVDKRGYPGFAALLARKGQIFYSAQVGYQDREHRVPTKADTIYRIYSMTKPIVCTAFMALFEEGRFQLLDAVAKYLPYFAKFKVLGTKPGDALEDLQRPITIRDLLTHTSGLAYGLINESPADDMYRQSSVLGSGKYSLEAFVHELTRFPLAYQPGWKWYYSVSIDVIGHLIQVLSDRPLQDFLAERLFKPLDMNDTAFYVPSDKYSRLAKLYSHEEGRPVSETEPIDVEQYHPSTSASFARGGLGLFSTAMDYMHFAQMLLQKGELDGSRILAPKTVELMHSNHLSTSLLPCRIGANVIRGYGFGLGSRVLMNVAESGMPGSVGEFGWGGAANTYYWVDPQEKIVGVLMTQLLGSQEAPQVDFQTLTYQAVTSLAGTP